MGCARWYHPAERRRPAPLNLSRSPMIVLEPVAHVRSPRTDLDDDRWGEVIAVVELVERIPATALDGIEAFSHAELLFHFHRAGPDAIVIDRRHPRGDTAWPLVGIFAQRGSCRPNLLGSTIVEIVQREGRRLSVRGLDAVDGTPVLDIKPVMAEFLPRGDVRQPEWSRDVMHAYWHRRE